MDQQNEKQKISSNKRDEKAPRDYNDLRSSYRHQTDANANYGNYNPASGSYENRLDDLTAQDSDLEFTNEYQDRPQPELDEDNFRSMNGRGSAYGGNDQHQHYEESARKKTQDRGYGQPQSDFRSIPGQEDERDGEPVGEFGFDGDYSSRKS